ncbi:MAG: DUF4397 domain-containing protein [Candidatus Promineifilaceae bacterium]
MKRLALPLLFIFILATAGLALAQNNNEPAAAAAAPEVRIVHAAPFAADVNDTAVTILVDDAEVQSDFKYGEFTDYLALAGPGNINVKVKLGDTVVIEETLAVAEDMEYTVAAVGDISNQPLELWVLVDNNAAPAAGNAHLRIAHAAPFGNSAATTAVDVCTQDGSLVNGLADVPYKVDSTMFPLPEGTYDLRIAAHDAGTPCAGATIIDPLPVTLSDGSITTVFAIGDGVNQSPGLLAIPGGLLPTANVRINHLAPFAMDLADTAVSITVDGNTVIEDFEFTEFTDYLPLPYAGDYEVAVFAGETEALSDTVTVEAGKEYSVSAIGGANGWPLEFFVLEDDNSEPAAGNAHLRIAHTAPFAATGAETEVDICTQAGDLVGGLSAVPYKVASGYLPLPAGTYDLVVRLSDTTACTGLPIIDPKPVELMDGDVVTVYAYGDGTNQIPGLLAVPVGVLEVMPPQVRVVHVAPFAAAISNTVVNLSVDGQVLPGSLVYLESTDYIPLPVAGSYLFEVLAGGAAAISDNITVGAGMAYTVAAIGDGVNQPLQYMVLTDDMSAPADGNIKLRIAHAAPFAANLQDTEVDICTQDGTLVDGLAAVPFGVSSDFLELPAGSYDLKVTDAEAEPCTGATIIDLPAAELPAGLIATVFAVGGVNDQTPGGYSPEFGRLGIPYIFQLPVVAKS